MSSILKVDTIQDQSGNNIINESGNVITIGASGDTITVPAGATVSGFTSAGIDDNATSTAITISSGEDVTFTENILLGDNKKAKFGTGNDLEIYHTGTQSVISDVGSGNLNLEGDAKIVLRSSGGSENYAQFFKDGAVELYYDNSKKFETTSTGSTVTGNINLSDSLLIDGAIKFEAIKSSSQGQESIYQPATDTLAINTGGNERLRIDSSGNLLIGKSSSSPFGTSGHEINANGEMFITRTGTVLNANRNSSDGRIINILKDGTSVGNIGARGGNLYVGNGDVALKYSGTNDAIFPSTAVDGAGRDNAIDLGASGTRFKDLYLSGGAFIGGTGTANKLDDYEEGTWTPAYRGASSAGSYSTNASGTYTKVGNLVSVTAHLKNITQNSAGSGSIEIAGLPFAKSSSQESDIGSIYLNLFSLGGSDKYAIVNVNPGVSHVLITAIDSDGASASTLQVSARQSDSSDMFFSVTYTT